MHDGEHISNCYYAPDKETSDYTLTVTPEQNNLYVHVECHSCQEKDARISELEAEAADLDELCRVLNLACSGHVTRWMRAEAALAERDRMLEVYDQFSTVLTALPSVADLKARVEEAKP
jgi:hypothetical protein